MRAGKSIVKPALDLSVDHIYLTVTDFERSRKFYDRLMKALGFKKGTSPIGDEPHCHYFNRNFQLSIRPARRRSARHDSYSAGLHHLCMRVASDAAVDEVARRLRAMKIAIVGPRRWPEYAPDYYAVFFNDPDGIRLEVMNHLARRKLVRRIWPKLEGVCEPGEPVHTQTSADEDAVLRNGPDEVDRTDKLAPHRIKHPLDAGTWRPSTYSCG